MEFRVTWSVDDTRAPWLENFSPNVIVTRARIREGRGSDATYLANTGLKVADKLCETIDNSQGYTEFDVSFCDPDARDPFRVTPAYRADALNQSGPVDNSIVWEARIPIEDDTLSGRGPFFIELDLTAEEPVGSRSSGLRAAPPALDLGDVQVGAAAPLPTRFVIDNWSASPVKVTSVRFTGEDAGEFGMPIVIADDSTTVPINLGGHEKFEIGIQPDFRSMAVKRTTLEVAYRDSRGSPARIRMPITATAVQPFVIMEPDTISFRPGRGAWPSTGPSEVRAFQFLNAGPIPVVRERVSISGPDAGFFRIISADDGAGATDVTTPLTLDPGNAEHVRIGFFPERAGTATATVTVSSSLGSIASTIEAICETNCSPPPGAELEPRELELRDGALPRVRPPRIRPGED